MDTTPHATTTTTPADAPGPTGHTSYEEITSPARRFLRRQRIRECLARIGAVEYSRRHYSEYGFLDPGEMTGLAVSVVESGWLPDFDLSDTPWPELAPDAVNPLNGIHALLRTRTKWSDYIGQLRGFKEIAGQCVADGDFTATAGDGTPRLNDLESFADIIRQELDERIDGEAFSDSLRRRLIAEWPAMVATSRGDFDEVGKMALQRIYHVDIEASAPVETREFLRECSHHITREEATSYEGMRTLVKHGIRIIPHAEEDDIRNRIVKECILPAGSLFLLNDPRIQVALYDAVVRWLRRQSTRELNQEIYS